MSQCLVPVSGCSVGQTPASPRTSSPRAAQGPGPWQDQPAEGTRARMGERSRAGSCSAGTFTRQEIFSQFFSTWLHWFFMEGKKPKYFLMYCVVFNSSTLTGSVQCSRPHEFLKKPNRKHKQNMFVPGRVFHAFSDSCVSSLRSQLLLQGWSAPGNPGASPWCFESHRSHRARLAVTWLLGELSLEGSGLPAELGFVGGH